MFFYVSLFVACVISAIVGLYLYNALSGVGKAIYSAFLPSSKDNRTRHLKTTRVHTSVNETAIPWGWKGNGSEIRDHGAKVTAENGASGFDALLNDHNSESASVGWPYREEKTEATGRTYKVTRKARPTGAKRRPGGKPWGW